MKKLLQIVFYFGFIFLYAQQALAQGDNCSNAQVISGLPFTDNGTTDGFTYDYDAGCGTGGNGAPDVVYRYTSPTNGFINISLCSTGSQTNYDTKMWVYRGSCSAPQEVACSEDACNNPGLVNDALISRITNMPVASGQTYFIVIGGFDEFSFGNFTIDVTSATPLAGTDCSNPIVISDLPFDNSANTGTFGDDIDVTPCSNNNLIAGDEVVYTYTPTADEFVDFKVSNISATGSLLITDACPDAVGANCVAEAFGAGSATELNANNLALSAGQTYYIVISTFPSPQSTNYTLGIERSTAPPIGSTCSAPIAIPTIPYQDLGKNTVDYGDDYNSSVCSPTGTDYMGGNEIVYTLTPAQNQALSITLKNIGADFTALHVLNNCPDVATACVAFAANAASRNDLQVIFNAQSGQTYYIVVSTWPNPQNTSFDLYLDVPTGVNLSLSPSEGSEADETVFTVTATSNTAVSSDQTVEIRIDGAISIADFKPFEQRITIPAGEQSGSIQLTVQDDNLGEGTEPGILSLLNPSPGIVLGSTTEQNLRILDNDNLVNLSIAQIATLESDRESILLTVNTTEPVSGNQQVNLKFSGEGVDDSDLSLSSTVFTIPDGTQSAQVTVQIKNDNQVEGDEMVRFSLSSASELIGLGKDSVVFLTIQDDEFAPVALDDNYTLNEDETLQIEEPGILGNDTDGDQDVLSANLMSLPSHGTLTLQADGKFLYVPEPDFNGTDSFSYQANDGFTNSTAATVHLQINAVNDPPRILRNLTLKVVPEASLIPVDSSYLQVIDTEDGADQLIFTLVSLPVQGQLSLNNQSLATNDTFTQADINSDRLTYTHTGISSGYDQFRVTVADTENGQVEATNFFILIDVVNAEENILQNGTKVHPNPSVDNFQIVMDNSLRGELQLRVRDSQGKLIKQRSISKQQQKLEYLLKMEDEAPGLYLLELQLDERLVSWRLVKE